MKQIKYKRFYDFLMNFFKDYSIEIMSVSYKYNAYYVNFKKDDVMHHAILFIDEGSESGLGISTIGLHALT